MLSELLTGYANLIGDVIVNRLGLTVLSVGQEVPLPAPRVLRYHGHAPPDDLECGDGILSVWWESIAPKDTRDPCTGPPVIGLAARYGVCWTLADADEGGITLYDDAWDRDAALLAEIAEGVGRALFRLTCGGSGNQPTGDAQYDALVPLLLQPRYISTAPTGATSNSAGVIWRIQTGLRAETPTQGS